MTLRLCMYVCTVGICVCMYPPVCVCMYVCMYVCTRRAQDAHASPSRPAVAVDGPRLPSRPLWPVPILRDPPPPFPSLSIPRQGCPWSRAPRRVHHGGRLGETPPRWRRLETEKRPRGGVGFRARSSPWFIWLGGKEFGRFCCLSFRGCAGCIVGQNALLVNQSTLKNVCEAEH